MIKFKVQLQEKIRKCLMGKYPFEPSMLDFAYTPQSNMGDLALAFPFQLAKEMKKKPRELALEILSQMGALEGVEKLEVAGPGYINLFLDKKEFFLHQLQSIGTTHLSPEETKVIIEHTNINPNKAAHIGHLRNAILGDTLGRCCHYKGEQVEIQNYIDDTGVQVVDVVFGFMEIERKDLDDIKKIKGKFDYYCWDLYARVSSYLESHPETQKRKYEILKKIEEGKNPETEIADYISRRILKLHLKTMKRLDIDYDLLPCESSILKLKFWEKASSLLKEKKAIYYVDKGENKGCWVMKLDEVEEKEKIIVRSDKTITYVGKDIAYQLWKFGLLEKDFYYNPFIKKNGKIVWITTSEPNINSPQFGKGSLVYNVIDTRQSYLQKIVVQGLKSLHYLREAEKSIHFSYEMVALSPKSLGELSLKVAEKESGKDFFEVSGRKGVGVKADDLLDRLEEKAMIEVKKRNPELPSARKADIAHKIAIGSLRYFMLKFARNSLIIFDFEEALNFEGETGPYLQYTYVRIQSIFRKLKEKIGFDLQSLRSQISSRKASVKALSESECKEFWDIVLYGSRFDEEVLHSIMSLEFSHLAKFTFNLCQKFNAYYHKYSVLAEKNKAIQNIRILTIYYVSEVLKKAFSLMGIPTPHLM